ncbi:T9SS C-terminal target domain-containing protein [Dysgonomonas sp. 216]|uniref:T9SS type A sorting domain-containing protein n=1 Tax=Dysgonomonas sp. 216 TaxID=2302934 RepID=UPI0013D86A74|nr:T9SS type A sorting domain-containing protein [Dysgonomonas sp. 216]NDW17538.1 T9SS C-terminal target domain-containing protein [Dysgonomonas sp. 216]
MKKLLLCLIIMWTTVYVAKSQVSYGGFPPSQKKSNSVRSQVVSVRLSTDNIDIEQLQREDSIAEEHGSPHRIAILLPLDIDINSSGQWNEIDGYRVWRQTVSAPGAKGLILGYKDFYIPPGAQLFVYNKNCKQLLGAYTNATNPGGGYFSNEVVYGDELVLEYVSSDISDEQPRLVIEDVGYVYANLSDGVRSYADPGKINNSADCMVNINCEEGDDWQDQKRGVVRIAMKYPNSWLTCSGSLVNNTNNDGTPYILTANHCFFRENQAGIKDVSDCRVAQFYFNYEFSSCDNQTNIPSYNTLVGGDLLVHTLLNAGSDGLLLKLKNEVPKEWDPYYNGWDLSSDPGNTGVLIHHPEGDVKKISTFSQRPTIATWNDGAIKGINSGCWKFFYSATANGKSVSEGGSSGSPLFNSIGLIIGTLSGGASYCESVRPGGSSYADFAARMSYHWDQYPDSEKWMKPFLNPSNKDVVRWNGYSPNSSDIPGNEESQKLKVTNPVRYLFGIEARDSINNIYVYDSYGRIIHISKKVNSRYKDVNPEGWSNGIYTVVVETVNDIFNRKIIKY